MARRKKFEPTIDDLVTLAEKANLCDDPFDGDLRDAADDEAEMMVENAKNLGIRGILQFLLDHGCHPNRLKELIKEYEV